MPPLPPQLQQPAVAATLGSLALSRVRPGSSTLALRSLRWHRDLERLGVKLPFFVVHDIGLLFAAPPDQLAISPRVDPALTVGATPGGVEAFADYGALLDELVQCEAARRSSSLKLSDDMIAVLLARLLGAVARKLSGAAHSSDLPADASLFDRIDTHLPALFAADSRSFELQVLVALRNMRLYVLTVADAMDLDTLRLLGVLGSETSVGAVLQVDLLAALASPAAHDVVNFSLEILPSVLETKKRPGSLSRDGLGCGGLGTRGSIDQLVLTELAWDAEDFARRVLENEVLYYSKETEREPAGRRHLVLIDASASMRGERQVFARGMALATTKKIVLEGEDVALRFFDSRLYEPHHARGGNLPTPHVLSFTGERGRNPRRVFSELITVLELERTRDARDVVIHVFTHAALYIPRELVMAVTRLAKLGIVFILPSGGQLDLDYLDLLDAHWVVDHATLAEQGARARKATDILGQIGERKAEATERASLRPS